MTVRITSIYQYPIQTLIQNFNFQKPSPHSTVEAMQRLTVEHYDYYVAGIVPRRKRLV